MFSRLATATLHKKSVLVALPVAAIAFIFCVAIMLMLGAIVTDTTKDDVHNCICEPQQNSSCAPPLSHVQPTAISQPPAACYLPDAYSHAIYSKTWLLLGDSFAAGESDDGTASWAELLHSRAVALSPGSVLLNIASQGGGLGQQFDAAMATAELRTAVAARTGVLLFVSYGAELLDTGSLELQQIADELEWLANQSKSFGFSVVLLQRPDPVAGGVRVDPAILQCSDALQHLNYPSLASNMIHRAAYDSTAALLQSVAQRYDMAIARPDVQFTARSLALSKTAAGSFFETCSAYNDSGHTMFSALLWACLLGKS